MAKKREDAKEPAEMKPGTIAKAWKITIQHSEYIGKLKYVSFFAGVGCLCGYGMASECPENYAAEGEGFRQVKGAPIEEYARYFRDRGFLVEEIPVDEGLSLYQKIEREIRDYKPPVFKARAETPEESVISPKAEATKTSDEKEVLPHESMTREG